MNRSELKSDQNIEQKGSMFSFFSVMIQKDLFKKSGLTWVAAELILGQRFGYVCLDRSLLEFLV